MQEEDGLALYEYWPIVERPPLEWPQGKKLAVYLGVNIEHWLPGRPAASIIPATAGLPTDPGNHGWRDYGARVGIWRLIELLDELAWPASVPLNSDVCREYPEVAAAGRERGWAWLAHGPHSSMVWTGMEEDEERAALRTQLEEIEAATGTRPRGWLGPALTETSRTPRLFSELGGTYLLDWCNDDQPHPLAVEPGPMVSVPYSIEVNDISAFVGRGESGPGFERMLVDQFEVLLAESRAGRGAVMAIGLHPYVVNQAFRHKYLARALREIAACEEAWLTTSDAIADFYLEHYDERARAALAARREGRGR